MTADYERGFEAGQASMRAEVDAVQRIADYWYFRANNPRAKWPESVMVNSIIEGMEVNEERQRRFAELDAEEQRKFDDARSLIAEGLGDIDIAKKVGLFVPIVENIRAGTL